MFMQYSSNQRIDDTAPANRAEEPREYRIRAKVLAHAELIGKTEPAPLILIDATRGKGNA